MIIIGEQLVKLRKENNMSQEKLAEILGVSRQTIYKWENNTWVLHKEYLLKK